MNRFVEIDLPQALAPRIPVWLTELSVGLACAAAIGLVRAALDFFTPGVAPFALIFPAIMMATLAARWPAGAVTATLAIGYVWLYQLPKSEALAANPRLVEPTIGVIILAAILTLVIADAFRRAVRNASAERDRQIADRDLFLEEFDHRVKNNFAIVASLLDLQRRRADPATAEALTVALSRIESIARAHRQLYRGADQPGAIEISDYLNELCENLSDSLILRGAIVLEAHCAPARLPRDRAISIGLIVNELVTNAAKHAFVGRDRGTITVRFAPSREGWQLSVADDGNGMPAPPRAEPAGGGLGGRLIDAFARQAGGQLATKSDAGGTTVTLTLAA